MPDFLKKRGASGPELRPTGTDLLPTNSSGTETGSLEETSKIGNEKTQSSLNELT